MSGQLLGPSYWEFQPYCTAFDKFFDFVIAHVHGEVVEGIKVDLAALIVRMSSLETSLHK